MDNLLIFFIYCLQWLRFYFPFLKWCGWGFFFTSLFNTLKFFHFPLSLGFLYWFYFSCKSWTILFISFDRSCLLNISKVFISSFRISKIFIRLFWIPCIVFQLYWFFSVLTVVEWLEFIRDILSWLLFIAFLYCFLGIWVLDYCNYLCWYLVLSLLGVYSISCFLLPTMFMRRCW